MLIKWAPGDWNIQENKVNTMAADALACCDARLSAAMELNIYD